MKYTIDFEANKSTIEVGANKIDEKLATVLANINESAVFDSGMIPVEQTGIISYRRGFGREQFVYQIEPQKHMVMWGQSESQSDKPKYLVAEPWKIIIADFEYGNFLGLRHFYSPENIMSHKQPLYAINLPNTNTVGYGGTSVGWTCLYRTIDTSAYSFAEKINYFLERESGANEPYNNANMSGTDGPRFYQRRKAPSYIWDPSEWQKKSKNEGVDWVLAPDLFTKLKIKWATDTVAEKHDDDGEVYTLGDAIHRPYYAYYPQRATQAEVLPINTYKTLVDAGKDPWGDPEFVALVGPIWRTGKASNVAVKAAPPKLSAMELLEVIRKNAKITEITKNLYLSDGILCPGCNTKHPADHNFQDIVTSYHFPDNDIKFSSILVDEYQSWCETCTMTRTVRPQEARGSSAILGNSQFSFDILEFSLVGDSFHLKEYVTACPNCNMSIANRDISDHMVLDVTKINKDVAYTISKGAMLPGDFRTWGICCSNCKPIFPYLHVSEWMDKTSDAFHTLKFGLDNSEFDKHVTTLGDTGPAKILTKYDLHVANLAEKKKGPGFQIEERFIPTALLTALNQAICPCGILSNSPEVCNMCLNENGEYVSQIKILSKINV